MSETKFGPYVHEDFAFFCVEGKDGAATSVRVNPPGRVARWVLRWLGVDWRTA